MYDIVGSIVTYKTDESILKKAIQSFSLSNLHSHLYIIDNSPTDQLRNICDAKNITYIFNKKNLGYGAGHNIAIKHIQAKSKYFLIMNPDISFGEGVLENLFGFMESNQDIGLVLPKVFYSNNQPQHLARLLPTPIDVFLRKLMCKYTEPLIKLVSKYELSCADHDQVMDAPYLSGCFMFVRMKALVEVGGFDERFFMYFEDVDFSRRINQKHRTVYYPKVRIIHGYERASSKDLLLFRYIIESSLKYFNKWGWFFDRERNVVNKKALNAIFSKNSKGL